VYKIEHRGFESFGMRVSESKYVPYFSFGLLSIFVPGLFLGFQNLFLELFEQILFIGFVEEVFYRGYLMSRFCEWKGDKWSLVLSSIFFSLAHVVFIVSNEGLRYPGFIGMTMLQTFIGGVFLGYIFLKEGNIIPGAIIHISTNIYMSRIFG
jgi:membrane protease YdiL (CAAX protease family)